MNKRKGRMAGSGVEHPLLREIRAAKAQGSLF